MLHMLQGSALCLQYAQRALLINEFTASRWQNGKIYPGTGPYGGQTLGNGILSQFGFPGELSLQLTRASVLPHIVFYMFCIIVALVSFGTWNPKSMLYSSPSPGRSQVTVGWQTSFCNPWLCFGSQGPHVAVSCLQLRSYA